MPLLLNPTDTDLFCPAAHRTVPARGSIQISRNVADVLRRNAAFSVEEDPSPTPTRETVMRGSRLVETTQAPAQETR